MLAGQQASAAALGLVTQTPSLTAMMASIDNLDLDPDGSLSNFAAEVDGLDGVLPAGPTEISFVADFALADPTNIFTFAFGGFLDITDSGGQFLVGDLTAIGFTNNTVELEFNNLTGSGAAAFGTSVLALVAFGGPLGPNPFGAFVTEIF